MVQDKIKFTIATKKEIRYNLKLLRKLRNMRQMQSEDERIQMKKNKLPYTHLMIQNDVLFTRSSQKDGG